MSATITATVLAEKAIYTHIPWDAVRDNVDYLFSRLPGNLQHDANADFLRTFDHRWHGGHDLLLDFGKTLSRKGPFAATHQAGHIILTDFPTKAGIPIPGFSESGLGHFLANTLHIPKGYLSLNLLNTGIGILAIGDGHRDLLAAFAGHLEWGWGTFFDTFVKGGIELQLGFATENPLLLVAGLENYAAGLRSVYDYVLSSTLPLDLLVESFGVGFIAGGLIAFLLARREPLPELLKGVLYGGTRAGVTSMLFAVSAPLGFAALGSLVTYQLARAVGERHHREVAYQYHLDESAFQHLLQEYCAGDDPNIVLAKAKEFDQVLVLKARPCDPLLDTSFSQPALLSAQAACLLKAELANLQATPVGELTAEMPSLVEPEQFHLREETSDLHLADSPVLSPEEGLGPLPATDGIDP